MLPKALGVVEVEVFLKNVKAVYSTYSQERAAMFKIDDALIVTSWFLT